MKIFPKVYGKYYLTFSLIINNLVIYHTVKPILNGHLNIPEKMALNGMDPFIIDSWWRPNTILRKPRPIEGCPLTGVTLKVGSTVRVPVTQSSDRSSWGWSWEWRSRSLSSLSPWGHRDRRLPDRWSPWSRHQHVTYLEEKQNHNKISHENITNDRRAPNRGFKS